MNLEFSFVTNKEKMNLMTTIPIEQHIQYEANKIKQSRQFQNDSIKQSFIRELNYLIQARSGGVPLPMKKPNHLNR